MKKEEIVKTLFELSDAQYRDFQGKLIPTAPPGKMIGVRTPQLRKFAKSLAVSGDYEDFLNDLPHRYFDENQLHAFIVSEIKDFDCCVEEVCRFLPYVDNWATCDQMSPKVFKKRRRDLLPYIYKWIDSSEVYTVRFGLGMLMAYFLDEDFDVLYLETAANVRSEEYYVKMMVAWYFATALAKQYEAALPFIEERRLDKWTHNKAIQKAVESYRITNEQKKRLKELKVKK